MKVNISSYLRDNLYSCLLRLIILTALLAIVCTSHEVAHAADHWFSDSFEGPLPNGWRDEWDPTWDTETVVNTAEEGIGSAPGGGAQAYRQRWNGIDIPNCPSCWSSAGGLGSVAGIPGLAVPW